MIEDRDVIGAVIGRNIAVRRKQLGISLEQLSDSLSLRADLLAEYEAGARRVDAKLLLSLGQILDVSPQYFFTLPDDIGQDKSWQVNYLKEYENNRSAFVKDGIRLNQAFARIRSPANRQLIIDIARAIADSDPRA